MAYIGKQPVVGNFVKLDAITTSATTTFNLTNGGVAYSPQSPNHCIVSLNGVIQSPTSAYTISGSTIVFSDALTSSDTIDFILVLGDVLNIGTPSDGTVTSAKLASGVSGLISWQSVQTTGFTAVAGRGYPCNTTSAAFTVTLPASPSAGDTIILLDYAGTFDTNALTINPNGNKIEGATANLALTGEREGATLTYIDSTQGWLANSGINEGTDALSTPPYSVDFLIVGGGAGGGSDNGGGGGGGEVGISSTSFLVNVGTTYNITVGAGGARATDGETKGTNGNSSSVFGFTCRGGGGGASTASSGTGGDAGTNGNGGGGSGFSDGASSAVTGGNASVSSSVSGITFYGGNDGGNGTNGTSSLYRAGGGAGSNANGVNGLSGSTGGNGITSSITGTSYYWGAGGGGGSNDTSPGNGGLGGGGGGSGIGAGGTAGGSGINTGGNGTSSGDAGAGATNTGSGGGGGYRTGTTGNGGNGGSGTVILKIATANYSGTTTGSPTVTDDGSFKILRYTGDGSYTA